MRFTMSLRALWLGLLIVSCTAPASTPSAPAPSGTTQPAEQRDDAQVINIGVGLLPAYLTPQASTTQHVFLWPLYDNLTQFGPNFEVRPSLAQRWELSADRLTWTFVLRQDVTWPDGSALTAEDVEYTITQAIDLAWPQRAFLGNVTQARAID